MVDNLLTVLEAFESAPSAHVLVKSIVTTVSDSEIDDIYNSSEGYNDQCTEQIISSMNDQQLQRLVDTLKEIDTEHKENSDEDEYLDNYGEASQILNSL